MTGKQLREHIELRASVPGGTISRVEGEDHAGKKGAVSRDVNPIALAFIQAAHGDACDCVHCDCGR